MGLKSLLVDLAAGHCTLLLAEVPGGWRARVEAERVARRRGWRLADAPGGADVLVVCGPLAPEDAGLVDAIWDQLPGPRARVDLPAAAREPSIDAAFDAAVRFLADHGAQRVDALQRQAPQLPAPDEHDGMDHGGSDHSDMDRDGMDMAPDGIALAGGAQDRDGLEMDELHVRLGPLLRHWPAGLVMTWTLHGDLVVQASGRWGHCATGSPMAAGAGSNGVAVIADALADLLRLVGWAEGADRAVCVRDLALLLEDSTDGTEDGTDPAGADMAGQIHALARRVRRSRPLRWSLRGVGRVDASWVRRRGLPPWWVGDAFDRLLVLLEALVSAAARPGAADARGVGRHGDEGAVDIPDANHLAELCAGVEVATARLVLASLAPRVGAVLLSDKEVRRA